MASFPTPIELALAVSTLVTIPLVAAAWRRRGNRGAVFLGGIAVGAALWAFGTLVGLATTGKAWWIWASVMTYSGMTLTVVSWTSFALDYGGWEQYVTPRRVALMAAIPAAGSVLAVTNSVHHLLWASLAPADVPSGIDITQYGPAFFVITSYVYLLLSVGFVALVRTIYRRQDLYRIQAAALLFAAIVPIVANLVYLVGPVEVAVTPLGFTVSSLSMFYAMYRFELVDLTPVARNVVVDNIQDLVLVVDDAGRLTDCNPAAVETFELAGDSAIGSQVGETFADYPELLACLEDREASHVDEIEVDTEDSRRYFDVDAKPLRDRRDAVVGRLFLLHDVTERRRRRAELERQNEQLDQFASLVSHDLRNPLTVAEGYVETVEAMVENPTAIDYLEEVEHSHDRMEAIIEDVLTLARQGQSVTETERVDVADVARAAWRNVDTGGATLEVDVDLTVEADMDRLLQVFENLFRNAVEHGTTGDGAVRVTIGDLSRDTGFYLEDDGPGISAAHRDEVFSDGFTTAADGTGLGLSIVQNVVEAHGWAITVTEGSAGGARFEVTGVGSTQVETGTGDDEDGDLKSEDVDGTRLAR